MLSVRPYVDADLIACRGLWRQLTQHHRDLYDDQTIDGPTPELQFDRHLQRPDLVGIWVADDDASVIGLVGLLLNGEEAQIEPIIVAGERRSQGVGELLLQHARREAIGRGAHFLSLMPVARNSRAIRKFISSGFNIAGQIDLFEDLRPGERKWIDGFDFGASLRF
jgi:GNAT superfamily N-acetyltransferase